MNIRLFLLFIAFFIYADAHRLRSIMNSPEVVEYERRLKSNGLKDLPDQWFTQRLDHFDLQDNRTYQQLYYINDTFWKIGNPIFLFIGCEGPQSSYWVVESAMMVYAKKFGAMGITIEHRFYGKSQPFSDTSVEHLRYLSVRQALADLSTFRQFITKKYNSPNSKWITFGGSYGGTLSAWARLKYPHYFAGAIADSGPVYAKMDMFEFNEVASKAVLTAENGKECYDNIKNGFELLERMVQSEEGKNELKNDFNLCENIVSKKDEHLFISNVYDSYWEVIQYDKPSNPTTINSLCKIFHGNESEVYKMMLNAHKHFHGEKCMNVNYEKYISIRRDIKYSDDRSWWYQTCSEFGWYQTTGSKNQIFGNYLPVEYFAEQCKDTYGIEVTQELMDETNAHFGGFDQRGSNIFWLNGGIDPWSAMSIIESDNQDLIYVPSASHCAPIYSPSREDSEAINMARYESEQHIAKYISSN